MTAKRIVNLYIGRLFHSSVANFGKVVVDPPKHQKIGIVGNVPLQVVRQAKMI